MKDNKFNFCPECGSKAVKTIDGRKWVCPDCGFDLYNNVAAAVGVIIVNDSGEVLFETRAKEPKKGFLALPGGFIDRNERAEEAALREVKEETGASLSNIKFICTFPNTYVYKNIEYKTCDMFFSGNIKDYNNFNIQESEVQNLVWKKVESLQDIENLNLAFESSKNTLKIWLGNKK